MGPSDGLDMATDEFACYRLIVSAAQIFLFIVCIPIIYLVLTHDRRKTLRAAKKKEERIATLSRAAMEVDEKFRKGIEGISAVANQDWVIDLAIVHLTSMQSSVWSLNPSTPLDDVPSLEWLRDRVRVHAEIAGCPEPELAHTVAESTLALLDHAISELEDFSASLRRDQGFHRFHESFSSSPLPRNEAKAQRLATLYILAFGDERQRALLSTLISVDVDRIEWIRVSEA